MIELRDISVIAVSRLRKSLDFCFCITSSKSVDDTFLRFVFCFLFYFVIYEFQHESWNSWTSQNLLNMNMLLFAQFVDFISQNARKCVKIVPLFSQCTRQYHVNSTQWWGWLCSLLARVSFSFMLFNIYVVLKRI